VHVLSTVNIYESLTINRGTGMTLEVHIRGNEKSGETRVNWSDIDESCNVVYVKNLKLRGEWYEIANTAESDTPENRKEFEKLVEAATRNTIKLLDTPKDQWPEHLRDAPDSSSELK
jgi:hypothetical protein